MLARKKDGALQCVACSRYCVIPKGQAGFCGVRVNEKGKLKLTVYGKPCSVWVDPIEKKPLFHFLPGSTSYSLGTYGCNFACVFCQNWDISQAPAEARKHDPQRWKQYFQQLVDRLEELPPERVVENAVASRCNSISFTYNEPTIFTEYAIDTMKIAKKKGLRGVYVSNGYESKECWNAISKYIDAVNIDLKAFNQQFYQNLCKANLDHVKESILYVKKKYPKMWVEITTLIVPGENDNEKELMDEAKWLASIDKDMPWHVTAFFPAYLMHDRPPTSAEILIKARDMGKMAGLKYVYAGNLPPSYSHYETTFCPKCGKELVKRFGFSVSGNNITGGKCRFCGQKIAGVWK